jgi:hypothetical protein
MQYRADRTQRDLGRGLQRGPRGRTTGSHKGTDGLSLTCPLALSHWWMQYPDKRPATTAGRGYRDMCRAPQACHAETKRRASLLAKASEADSFQVRVDAVAVITDICAADHSCPTWRRRLCSNGIGLVIQVAGTRASEVV